MNNITPIDLAYFASKPIEELSKALNTDFDLGLSSKEAKKRIKENGLNVIPFYKRSPWWNDLLNHFKSPLIVILLIASII